MGPFSNLNLNGRTSARAQPRVGVWGPQAVPTTGQKNLHRVLVWLGFFLALAALITYGTVMYFAFFDGKS